MTVHDLIARCDGFKPARIAQLAIVCEADALWPRRARGKRRIRRREPDAARTRLRCRCGARMWAAGLEGPAVGEALRRRGSWRSPPRAGSDRLFGGGGIDAGEDAIHRVRGEAAQARVRTLASSGAMYSQYTLSAVTWLRTHCTCGPSSRSTPQDFCCDRLQFLQGSSGRRRGFRAR